MRLQTCTPVTSLPRVACRRDLLSARWCEPSLSVVDVRVGDDTAAADEGYRFGPTRFSVVPRSATGHVSIRFVPDQDAGRLTHLFRCAAAAWFVLRRCKESGLPLPALPWALGGTLMAGGVILMTTLNTSGC